MGLHVAPLEEAVCSPAAPTVPVPWVVGGAVVVVVAATVVVVLVEVLDVEEVVEGTDPACPVA